LSETTRLAIGVGFVGAYTTFSTLLYDTNRLWTVGEVGKSAANVILSLILGIVAIRLGIAFGRRP
jgi:CrcB protein